MVLEIVEADGDVDDLIGQTLYQDTSDFNENVNKAYGSITKIEKLRREGVDYVKVGIDYDFSRDTEIFGTLFGEFKVTGKTKLIDNVGLVHQSSVLIQLLDSPLLVNCLFHLTTVRREL